MTEQAISNSPIAFSSNHSFLIALLVAVIVHVVFVLGVSLPKPEARQFAKDIDITIINTPSTKAPEKSEFVAKDNQLAQGKTQINKPEPAKQQSIPQKPVPHAQPAPKTPEEKVKPKVETQRTIKTPPERPKVAPQEKRTIKTPPEQNKPKAVEKTQDKPVESEKVQTVIASPEKNDFKTPEQTVPKDLFQTIKPEETEKETKPVKQAAKTAHETEPKQHHPISAAMLQQQIADAAMETTRQPASAKQTKTKSVSQVSANKSVAAQYKHDWESKVERIGNLNYPEAASKPGFSSTLTMDVGIRVDGTIDSIRITKSSGNPELDEAAIKIVRMCAPFPPLPAALRNELDILLITRVWKFTDESGLVTQ
jgi:periplasmic protein TonB